MGVELGAWCAPEGVLTECHLGGWVQEFRLKMRNGSVFFCLFIKSGKWIGSPRTVVLKIYLICFRIIWKDMRGLYPSF